MTTTTPIHAQGIATFSLTPDDGGQAQRAMWQATFTTWRRFLLLFAGLMILYVGFFIWRFPTLPGGLASIVAVALFFSLCLPVAVFGIYLLLAPWYGRRVLRGLRTIEGEFTCSWDRDTLAMSHPIGSSRIVWSLFHSWIDSPQALLIRHSRYQYSLIPKRALAPAQADDIAMHLRAAGVRELRRFGIIASPLGCGKQAA